MNFTQQEYVDEVKKANSLEGAIRVVATLLRLVGLHDVANALLEHLED